MVSASQEAFKLTYQISPIILTNGVAGSVPGSMLPIISLSQSANFAGLIGPGDLTTLDNYLLHFWPLHGASLIDQKIGMYPFANQQIAANAVIREPLSIAFRMDVSAQPFFGAYATKLATITALQATLADHNNSGGTYTLVTPSYTYTNCVMIGMRDISNGRSKQPQNAWQLEFIQPLITLQQALQAEAQMNSTMSQINAGVSTQGDQSGFPPTIGAPTTLATGSVAPAASNLGGTNTTSLGSIDSGVAGSAFSDVFGP